MHGTRERDAALLAEEFSGAVKAFEGEFPPCAHAYNRAWSTQNCNKPSIHDDIGHM